MKLEPFVLRPVQDNDLPRLQGLVHDSEDALTTLPDSKMHLENKIMASLRAFDPRFVSAGSDLYLFVLENKATEELVGISGILARIGGFEPFYTFRITLEAVRHDAMGINRQMEILYLTETYKGPSELCSLLLSRSHRAHGLGRLLSLPRFLFMGLHPERFEEHVIAELRGFVDERGHSPFWDTVSCHFFGDDYHQADYLSGIGNKQFITDLVPRHPIYVSLLPEAVRKCIGKVHPMTEPAKRLLLREGLAYHNEVDIFDAGPMLRGPLKGVRTVAQSRRGKIRQFLPENEQRTPDMLIARPSLEFRATLGWVVENGDGTIDLPEPLADWLEIAEGQEVIYVESRPKLLANT